MSKCVLCGEGWVTDDPEGWCEDCLWLETRFGKPRG